MRRSPSWASYHEVYRTGFPNSIICGGAVTLCAHAACLHTVPSLSLQNMSWQNSRREASIGAVTFSRSDARPSYVLNKAYVPSLSWRTRSHAPASVEYMRLSPFSTPSLPPLNGTLRTPTRKTLDPLSSRFCPLNIDSWLMFSLGLTRFMNSATFTALRLCSSLIGSHVSAWYVTIIWPPLMNISSRSSPGLQNKSSIKKF